MRGVIARLPFDLTKGGVLELVMRAMAELGFTCRTPPEAAPADTVSPVQRASAMLGTSVPA
ncbi:hypothetical protein [Streptomyces sp. NPDC016845]|uniref:hypothetical protein n=1 Tax=Streptomyces sp. NPDC016845 TaxID=3364972 RepID=UPI0037969D5C